MYLSVVFFFVFLIHFALSESLFDFSVENLEGEVIPLSNYGNAKAILLVNVASQCGYTYTNYVELQDMYARLKDRGLEILAFPCNQFGNQEPGGVADIKATLDEYGITFPVFAKVDVNGKDAHPLFKYLKRSTDNMEISWNFSKFLLINGYPVGKYRSNISPRTLETEIVNILGDEKDL